MVETIASDAEDVATLCRHGDETATRLLQGNRGSRPRAAGFLTGRQCRRLHAVCKRLQIPPEDVAGCRTLGALQKLAKPRYHALALRYHPDRRRCKPYYLPHFKGSTWRMINDAYHWLMSLDKDVVPQRAPQDLDELDALILLHNQSIECWEDYVRSRMPPRLIHEVVRA